MVELQIDPIFGRVLQEFSHKNLTDDLRFSVITTSSPQLECLLKLVPLMKHEKVVEFVLTTYKMGGAVLYECSQEGGVYFATPSVKDVGVVRRILYSLMSSINEWLNSNEVPNELAKVMYFKLLPFIETQPGHIFQGVFLIVTPDKALHIDFRTRQGISFVVATDFITMQKVSGAFNLNSSRSWGEIPVVQSISEILKDNGMPTWARRLLEALFINTPNGGLINLPFGAPYVIYQLRNLVLRESLSVSVSFCFEDKSLVIVIKKESNGQRAVKFKTKVRVSSVEIQELPMRTSGIIFRVGGLEFSVFMPFPVEFVREFFSS